ncbi:MAG: aminotransferase class V-fold PLP-dependent enzyme [Candidatus Latescibacteria bacterium]|nr:aminotransferase class V-fold PLP-dependent enzyme [Candidatus Latescibacterota bacterium]MBT4138698.1 aminotransferase class V-fold PLP-dependent enzyme [Candidatus Latescibacterota bacterium]
MTPIEINDSWPTTPKEESFWQTQTEQFMLDPSETYLNTGSWGSLPRPVFESMVQGLEALEGNPTRNRGILLDKLREARETIGNFINAPAEDIAFVQNVTVAINMVVHGLTWQAGDEILASDQEYGAIDNCLDHAEKLWGVKVTRAAVPIPASDPEDIVAAFRKKITKKTKLLVCSHIATRTGVIIPVHLLADLAHEHGARIAVDGAHAPGMIPLDLIKSGVDFYGGNCHKWLCAPKGTGFLYTRPEHQANLHHLIVSWGYNKNGPSKEDSGLKINNQPYMWQLEHWGTREMAGYGAIKEAVDFQNNIGKEKILQRGQQLAGYFRDQLVDAPWAELCTPTHPKMTGSITTFRYSSFDFEKFNPSLYNDHRITTPVFNEENGVAQRVSTHIYNSFEQVDQLVDVLRAFQAKF